MANDKPSTKDPHSGLDPLSPSPTDKPKSKKGLWVALGAVAAVAVFLVLLLKPKAEEESLDTQAYNACQTVADYRAYLNNYGRNAEHYDDAKAFVDQYVTDSTAMAQQLLADQNAQQLAETEMKKEDEAYKLCTTVEACDSYLIAYPQGKYIEEVKAKKAELEKNTQKIGSYNGHDYVDLGLPSGTLWATCNVGASSPGGYGNYYAWGETKTKTIYNWESYKYAEGTTWNNPRLTKYCSMSNYGNNGFTDNLTTLQVSDDPATAWGSGWRTPSKAQWDELLNNTTNKWMTQNGVKGRLFISKKNRQTLFLPAAGCRWDKELYYAASDGNYWCRSLTTGGVYDAWYLGFYSDACSMNGHIRSSGFSVRPVREK